MKRKSDRPLQKVTLNVYRGDWDSLKDLHPEIGPSLALREILHAHVEGIKEQVARTAQLPTIDPAQLKLF